MTTVVPIKGDIVTNDYGWLYDLFGDDYASPKSVSDLINKANGDDLSVESMPALKFTPCFVLIKDRSM